jgi:hypothetical protein
MHPATPQADVAIVRGVDELNRITAVIATARKDLAALRLPIASANDSLDYADDLLVTVGRMCADAYSRMESDFTRILKADDGHHVDDYANENEREAANDEAADRKAA